MLGSHRASQCMMAVLFSCFLPGTSMAEEATYSWTGAYAGANLGVIWTGSPNLNLGSALVERYLNILTPDNLIFHVLA